MKKLNCITFKIKHIYLFIAAFALQGCLFGQIMYYFNFQDETVALRLATDGDFLYRSKPFRNTSSLSFQIEKINLNTGVSETILGGSTSGQTDGVGTSALFSSITDIAIVSGASTHKMYIADKCAIREVNLETLQVNTIAGVYNTCSSVDGIGTAARFNTIAAILEKNNSLYVADFGALRVINLSTYEVTTIAGDSYGNDVDNVGLNASFNIIGGMTFIENTIYFLDSSSRLKKINLDNLTVSTVFGSPNLSGVTIPSIDGDFSTATLQIDKRNDLTSDSHGVLFFTEPYKIRKVILKTGQVSTVLNSSDMIEDIVSNQISTSEVYYPTGLHFTKNGLYITNFYNVRRMY